MGARRFRLLLAFEADQPSLQVSTARDDPVMEGASLFMPSRGSSTSRKSLQQEDSQPPTCRQDLRRKLLNDTASNQNKPAVPSSVEKLLQPVVL